MKLTIPSLLVLLVSACALSGASALAANQQYLVTVNTSPLVGNANAPFSLDFQLNYGSGPFGNNATIGNFNFGGGAATGTANPSGTAAGDIGSTVTLSDDTNHAFNELYQTFTPGSTLSFNVTLSNNTTINTPDALIFSILDNTLGQIPTTQPTGSPDNGTDGTDLADFDIGGLGQVNQQITVLTYAGANNPALGGDYSGVTVTVVAVPEPSSWALAGLGAGIIVFLRRRAIAQS